MLELRRKIFHIFAGLFLIAMMWFGLIDLWVLSIVLLVGIIISLLCRRIDIPVISPMLRFFDRRESLPGKGALTFVLGAVLVWAIFYDYMDIVYASIMILTLGDSFSMIFSRYFGRTKTPLSRHKMLEGTIAGFLAGALGAALFIPIPEAFAASAIAMALEAIGIRAGERVIDDNITIPLAAGATIYALRLLF